MTNILICRECGGEIEKKYAITNKNILLFVVYLAICIITFITILGLGLMGLFIFTACMAVIGILFRKVYDVNYRCKNCKNIIN